MEQFKKGDFVVRKSYGKDVAFIIKEIIKTSKGNIAILKGIVERVEADSPIEDLEKINKKDIKENFKKLDIKINEKIKEEKERTSDYSIGVITKDNRNYKKLITGKVLHLDGDRRYTEKSYQYYKKIGINAVVKNIPEYKQPKLVYRLLTIYNPDILIVTRTWWNDKTRNKILWYI